MQRNFIQQGVGFICLSRESVHTVATKWCSADGSGVICSPSAAACRASGEARPARSGAFVAFGRRRLRSQGLDSLRAARGLQLAVAEVAGVRFGVEVAVGQRGAHR